MKSPWHHYDVIIMWFSIFLGQKTKILYLWNYSRYRICSYVVQKHLPSFERWLMIGMDISVSDREISVLNSNKIPEKLEFLVRGPKMSVFENWLIFYVRVIKISNGKVSSKIYAFLRISKPFTFFYFYNDLIWNHNFFFDQLTEKFQQIFIKSHKTTF